MPNSDPVTAETVHEDEFWRLERQTRHDLPEGPYSYYVLYQRYAQRERMGDDGIKRVEWLERDVTHLNGTQTIWLADFLGAVRDKFLVTTETPGDVE